MFNFFSTPSIPSQQEDERSTNRFDILRLFAAWLVLFSHSYPLTGRPHEEPLASSIGIDTLGGIGVSIFFVVSGYLVTISWERSQGVWDFVKRRAYRIYPALLGACLLTVLFLGPWLTPLSQLEYWKHAQTWGYFMTVTAFEIDYNLSGLFADNPLPNAVNGSLWSLAYEVRFYVYLILLGLLPGLMRYKFLTLLLGLSGIFLLRATLLPASVFDTVMGLDYYDAKLGILFCIGGVFASWRQVVKPDGWFALAMLLTSVFFVGAVQVLIFLIGLGTFVLWLGFKGHWLPKLPRGMGDWSYGLYLYAFPVQQTLAHFRLHEQGFALYVLCSSALTLLLAGLSWHLVEKVALRWKARIQNFQPERPNNCQ